MIGNFADGALDSMGAGASSGEPVLVQRLDRLDDFSYIIPWQRSRSRLAALAGVDARLGVYKQAAAAPEGPNARAAGRDEEGAARPRRRPQVRAGGGVGRLLVRPEVVCVHPTLVWKPCRESLSPFSPFHLITVGGRHLYVPVDGAVFTALHDTERGI